MKNLFSNSILAAAILFATSALADDRIIANQSVNEFPTMLETDIVSTDFVPVYDTSAVKWKKVNASRLSTGAKISTLTAASSLTTANCGQRLLLNSATEFATTLPAPTAGCELTFIVKAAPSGASYTVLTASSANVFIGHAETADVNSATDADSGTADDTITITDAVAVVGDQIELYSDGTSWYWLGHSVTYNAIVATQAS